MTEDRVTLPLSAVRAAADRLCDEICTDPPGGPIIPRRVLGEHDRTCLRPLLAERDLMVANTYLATSISQDCLKGKHPLCKGCACHHHELKTGRMRK